jgi:hypothetical protein
MLQEAAAAARRIGAKGASLARRAEDLLAGLGPIEPAVPVSPRTSRRRESAEREPRAAAPVEVTEDETTPAEPAQGSSGDSVFRETTLPPL